MGTKLLLLDSLLQEIFRNTLSKMSVEEIRERFVSAQDHGHEAFEELAAYTSQLEAELWEKKEQARGRMAALKESNAHQREKLHRLREKYEALLNLYNEAVEDAKERSDSSSSSSSSDDDDCSIM